MKELVIPAINDNLNTVLDFISVFLEEAGFQVKQIMQVNIAVEEIYINIAVMLIILMLGQHVLPVQYRVTGLLLNL